MENNRRFDKNLIFLVLVLIFLVINLFYSLAETIDYHKRIESGNDRWRQVENIIVSIEEKVNVLEGELYEWKR